MQFEHLIEVNDLMNPLMDTITRQQLWQGLVLRAESPKLFVPQLDECTLQPDAQGLGRRLRYGKLVVLDRVTFYPHDKIEYEVAAQDQITRSHLCMRIEEPAPDQLFVRFTYTDASTEAEDAVNAMYNDFRRSAYKEADIDTIRIIREMAEKGQLNLV